VRVQTEGRRHCAAASALVRNIVRPIDAFCRDLLIAASGVRQTFGDRIDCTHVVRLSRDGVLDAGALAHPGNLLALWPPPHSWPEPSALFRVPSDLGRRRNHLVVLNSGPSARSRSLHDWPPAAIAALAVATDLAL
jgi:hypothetical protein